MYKFDHDPLPPNWLPLVVDLVPKIVSFHQNSTSSPWIFQQGTKSIPVHGSTKNTMCRRYQSIIRHLVHSYLPSPTLILASAVWGASSRVCALAPLLLPETIRGSHQGFGLRGCASPSAITNVEPKVLHSLRHELTPLHLEPCVVFFADVKELHQQEYIVLVGSRAYVIDVCFNLDASGYGFLHHRSST